MPTDIPSSVYKNAIDLNRYSNSVAKRLVVSYNRIVLDAVRELREMVEGDYISSYRAQRLRQILGSFKTSLDSWVGDASSLMKGEITELAAVEAEFAIAQLLKQVPGADGIVREITVSPQFAEAIVSTDPTELNTVLLRDDLEKKVLGAPRAPFNLGTREGALVTLPNGEPLEKAFRGIAASSAQKFRLVVQDGLLTGEPIDVMVKKLVGKQLRFSTEATTVGQIAALRLSTKQIADSGGDALTRLANHQVMALVRTSVNQVSNIASQQTYKSNREITDNFIFVATLDSRTSLTCASKDGKEFSYDDGPVPPLHFNCRSTTVAVPNWKKLKAVYGIERPDKEAMRASSEGLIPAGEDYGQWLSKQGVEVKEQVLGKSKARYFDLLVDKYGPKQAIRKLVSTDGSEKTLKELRAAYSVLKTSS